MSQLIMTVISIALVVALALATVYYGGGAWTSSSLKANVATMVNQAQQVSAAHTLYKTNNLADAANIQTLVDTAYLRSSPPAPAMAASGAVWTIDPANDVVSIQLETGNLAEIAAEVENQTGEIVGDFYYYPL